MAEIPAQEWPQRPGPRTVKVLVHYPTGALADVTSQTGIMLTLHNWGGKDCDGTANPDELARQLNVIALCVNYLQSGPKDSIEGPEPYDFGYLQALDALRSVYWIWSKLIFITKDRVDGTTFTTTGHALGNRTRIVFEVAGKYLRLGSPDAIVRQGPTDFERREEVRYQTSNGEFAISYREGYPTGRFHKHSKLPE